VADLSITALYTSQVWAWAKLPRAELCATVDGKRVFDVTNAALALARKPPLRFALLHRHAMIDHVVRASGRRHVVELAAGLSRRGATFADELEYIEVDLPAMIARKRELMARTPEGRRVLERLRLVEGDATTIDLAPLTSRESLVIAEGLCMYLPADARRRLFAKIAATGARFVFDLVPTSEEPRPGVSGRLLEAMMKRFTGGRTFERDAATRDVVLGELRDAGFADCEAIASRDVARAWQLPHPERATTMVVFSARASGTRA
jgi:O-methyltransferase involved in polyketide biosynthesis